MISIDPQPNLALPLMTAGRLTLYLTNQTLHNWLFVVLNKLGGGGVGGASFSVLAVIKRRPMRSHEEKKTTGWGVLNGSGFTGPHPRRSRVVKKPLVAFEEVT